jgi:hypothetical protein
VGDTDFTVGVSAIADATALAAAINQATPLSVTATDDLAGGITLRNNLETDGTITEDVDSGGVATVVDFVDGDMSLTAPGIGAFNGSQNLRGGTTTGVVVQDIDVLLSGVSAAAIDTGNCLLDIWAWRLGTDNAATFEVEALDANMDFLATLFTTTSEAIIDDTEWVKRGTKQKLIPTLTRFLRIKFTATLTGTPPILQYFDNVYGWVVDPAGAGGQLAPYEELIFRCTQAGTTGASQGADDYPAGAIGAVTTDGTAKFVGEEAWTRGASAISVTEGSSRIFRAEPQEYRAVTGWYNGGIVEFITGANAGGKMEIKTWTRDGAPTSTASRVEYTLGTADQMPFIPWSDRSHINWDTGSVYWHASSLGGLTETFAEYSILTLAQVTTHDMTKSPEFTTGVEISGVDPHTGYMSGAHFEFVGGGDDHYWEYVFNPATDTYVTINDNFANARTTDFLGDLQTGHCYLTHATSGLQAVVSTNQTEVRVHSFPGLVFQKSWDVVFPVQAGWAKAAVIDARSDEAYLVTNRTDTSFEIFKLTIDVAGVVSRVSIGTVTNSDFPPAVTAMDKFESRLVPHYDAVTDTIFFNAPMKHGASFTRYGVSYDVPGETVNWTTQLPSSNIDSGAFPHYYARLDGGYWGRNVGTFDYLLVDLVTGDWEQRWGASNNPDVHAVFWDDTTDSFYSLTHDGPFASQAMIKTRYVTVTIAPGTLELFLSLPFPVEAGDLFTLSPGCDKARVTCAAIFDNVTKMLAAPDVPGQDALFSYPDVKS